MKIRDLIKQLEDMLLIYGDRTILTITDIESEYSIKEINGKMCAKYFEPSDHVAEVTVRIKRNSSIKTLPSAQQSLLDALEIIKQFLQSCRDSLTCEIVTPDGMKLHTDWGYFEEGLEELRRYAERRTDETD